MNITTPAMPETPAPESAGPEQGQPVGRISLFSFTDRMARRNGAGRSRSSFLTYGGSMYRYLTAFIVFLGLAAFAGQLSAQTLQPVSGYLTPGHTKVFYPRVPGNSALDTIYEITGNYNVSGALQISEGAEVWFLPNSRILDSAGGKIIANGFCGLNRRILFRGLPVNANSFEWGHIDVLPNADSAYFANVRFVGFMKRNSVDVTNIYSDPVHSPYNTTINNALDGVGGVIATFSAKTYIYDAIVDSCQASFAGGAFAFMQAPAGWPNPDDARLALANHQVTTLTIRDTKVINAETSATGPTSTNALGGAIYIASNTGNLQQSDFVLCYLGYSAYNTGSAGCSASYPATQDKMLFERCTADNTFGAVTDFAKGGAIFVGSNTGLSIAQCTFNNDSAIDNVTAAGALPDANAWGGAISVSPTSGNPSASGLSQSTEGLPGLKIYKTASFAGCVAGVGGAIHLDFNIAIAQTTTAAPRLNIDAENFVTEAGHIGLVRDSGLIQFNGNIAYTYGGAIYSPNLVFIAGYLAPQNFPWPGGSQDVELRVKFANNIAGEGGGSTFLDFTSGGVPDLQERRAWHLQNSVNPYDPRVNRSQYGLLVLGGGAEFVGERDSTFSTEYTGNTCVGGNGGAVDIEDEISINGNPVTGYATNRFFAEDQYNASNVTVARDPGHIPFPFDPRELTRFQNNTCLLGPDSTLLYDYTRGTAHGRGGAVYVHITSDQDNALLPQDSTFFSRVRFEGNQAYSGSAIWSDEYDLKMMTNSCLIANNHATSQSSANVDLDQSGISNPGDVNAGATIWADFEGALPSYETNSRGDAIYDNTARYILRLPVSRFAGKSGADTLRGNFWGNTGPNVITEEPPYPTGPQQSTFFIDYYQGCFGTFTSSVGVDSGIYEQNRNPVTSYTPPTIGTLPDTMLMEGRVYDLFDAGNNMKVADYAYRRLAPAEAFSLGITNNVTKLHRFTRNLFDNDPTYVSKIDLMQTDFTGPHPIGYPLFLQADVPIADSNRDDYAENYTVFFVFNQTTNEYVRVNLKETVQAEASSASQQTYQGRLDFVPDSSVTERSANSRQSTLYTLALLRPSVMTFAEVQRASQLEDSAALAGREYQLSAKDMTSSAPGDSICTQGIAGTSTWYAGEKYHTLPVRPGDQILVISRTQLWKYGAAFAIANGLQFVIGDVTPPAFVGDIPALQTATYNPNVLFVHEDVNYDASTPAKTMFRIAGWDPNSFYDPRFLFNPGNYTQIALTVTPDLLKGESVPTKINGITLNAAESGLAKDSVMMHVRLNHWLRDSTIYNQNITGSNGYLVLKGQPHNPDVVPGGEAVTATITNYPPNYNSESGLKSAFPGILGADSNNLSMWTFPAYMNCPSGFLPDTLCVRSTSTAYHFRIVVEDSLPRFIPEPLNQCANLTDSLRFTFDANTDDEWEDSVAAADSMLSPAAVAAGKTGNTGTWDFRFGRTTYDFKTQPSWMVEPQGGSYVPIGPSDRNFQTWGIMNVRLDSATAVSQTLAGGPYILPVPQNNGELNLDTIVGLEADDGHTGKTLLRWPVQIHFVPTIVTQTLPDAKEGVDYSLDFNNPLLINRIIVYNPNPAVYNTYKLLYQGDPPLPIWRDGIYHIGSGYDTLGNRISDTIQDTLIGTTPHWLKIDQYSGVLSGTPGIADAPRFAGVCGDSAVVTVVVTGDCQLSTWERFKIAVDSVGHPPVFIEGPGQLCVENFKDFCDSVRVVDQELLRDSCVNETLTVTSLSPNDTVENPTVKNQLQSDTAVIHICGRYNEPDDYFTSQPLIPEYVHLKVTDAEGNVDTISYAIHIMQPPTFSCMITVSNAATPLHPDIDAQLLCFGAGSSGTDGIDPQYCEFEVPPATPPSQFDARWILPAGDSVGDGTIYDIRDDTAQYTNTTWQVEFQPGNDAGGAGSLYPVLICWNASCIDSANLVNSNFAKGTFYLRNPRNSNEFMINMMNGQGPIDNSLYTWMRVGNSPDSMCLQIRDQGLINALIVFVPGLSGVGESAQAPQFGLEANYPNPFSEATTMNFSVATRSVVSIDIYDVKGTLVRSLVHEEEAPGSYPITWDGTDAAGAPAPDGTYIARMSAGDFSSTVKMSLERASK